MTAALAATALSLAVLSVSGLIVGWQIHADLLHAVAGYALLIAFGFAMPWIGVLIRVPLTLRRFRARTTG